MPIRRTPFRCLAPFLLGAALTAQAKAPDPGLVERTIAKLANADAKAAEATTVALIRGDQGSVPLLRAVLASRPAPAVRERAERALRICSIDAPIENGLKVGLQADQGALAAGKPIRLTSTLCNVTDRPIAVYLGMSYSGNVLENGLALVQQVPAGTPGAVDGRVAARFGAVGFCGTGAQPIVAVVPPWSTHECVMALEYRTAAKPDDACKHDGAHLAAPWVFLPLVPTAGRVQLQVHQEVVAAEARGMVEPAHQPDWNGVLRSNVLELAVVGKPGR